MPDPGTHPDKLGDNVSQLREKAVDSVHQQTAPPSTRSYRSFIFQVYLVIAIGSFLILAVLARSAAYFPIDVVITRSFQSLTPLGLPTLMEIVSWPGYAPQVLLIGAILILPLFILKFTWEGTVLALSAVFTQAINTLVKFIIARPRPSTDIVSVFQQVAGYSFPSGHVMFYTAFFGFLAYLSFTTLKHSLLRILLVVGFTLAVILVGPSRVYLGEHWASDVLGGYLLGSLALIATIQLYHRGWPKGWPKFVHRRRP